jgi:hypothetical protein
LFWASSPSKQQKLNATATSPRVRSPWLAAAVIIKAESDGVAKVQDMMDKVTQHNKEEEDMIKKIQDIMSDVMH